MVECVVAEDEDLLRAALVAQLRQAWPELQIAAECSDGASALEAIAERQPAVAFLDIRMPGLTGIEVARAVADASPATQVVFVTAYDQYAVEAFEHGAVDYLLKPVSQDRLEWAVQRLKARGHTAAPDVAVLDALLKRLAPRVRPEVAPLAWVTATVGRETRLILLEDVAYFRADQKYTVVMTAEGEALLRTPLRELLVALDPAVFKQIHRSTIVNLKAVASVLRDDSGKGQLRLRHRPESLTVSQPFMGLFKGM
ncbi:two component transcriptional regulator, LytTR family [Pseudoxanthomonas sp. GM95]|uniref:LytR/AlgR family response regulator transcription factor n=1 Tax=Pseudoxanthomonas sp. GM95 TaxID=1881043 RepID=UPI0008B684B4|nr:LytTR family DNA-binding domain-containing protein [Pseudoxanthomonas sp. GM95]SEL45619.1 two component transcriptional regulator, LytTR family [Pseudoxanthomonas sp. GM95]